MLTFLSLKNFSDGINSQTFTYLFFQYFYTLPKSKLPYKNIWKAYAIYTKIL